MTKELYLKWREMMKAKAAAAVSGGSAATDRPEPRRDPTSRVGSINPREARLNEFKALVNARTASATGRPSIGLMFDSPHLASGMSPESALFGLLKSHKADFVPHVFREDAVRAKGFFADMYQGNMDLLSQATSLAKLDYLILGKLTHSFRKGSSIDNDLVSCELNLSCKVANRNGAIIRSDSFNAVGAGYSENAAIERALEILSQANSRRAARGRLRAEIHCFRVGKKGPCAHRSKRVRVRSSARRL